MGEKIESTEPWCDKACALGVRSWTGKAEEKMLSLDGCLSLTCWEWSPGWPLPPQPPVALPSWPSNCATVYSKPPALSPVHCPTDPCSSCRSQLLNPLLRNVSLDLPKPIINCSLMMFSHKPKLFPFIALINHNYKRILVCQVNLFNVCLATTDSLTAELFIVLSSCLVLNTVSGV